MTRGCQRVVTWMGGTLTLAHPEWLLGLLTAVLHSCCSSPLCGVAAFTLHD